MATFEDLLYARVGRSAVVLDCIASFSDNSAATVETYTVCFNPLSVGWTSAWFSAYVSSFVSKPAIDMSDPSGATFLPSTPKTPTFSAVTVGRRLFVFLADVDLASQPADVGWDLAPRPRHGWYTGNFYYDLTP